MWLPILQQQHIKRIIFSAVVTLALFPSWSIAQAPIHGLEVTPFLLELDVAKGGTIASQIDLINHSTQPLTITITPRDFLPGQDGQPEFVPDEEINDRTFSLASWVTISGEDRIVLSPGQLRTVNFTVNPPTDSEQGTHYGAILFSFTEQSSQGEATEVLQTVGTILLVYYGQTRENGIVSLATEKKVYWTADKVEFANQFNNIGNVHVKPKGEVYVRNMFGQTVATSFINRDAANVLPRTERKFMSTWYPSSFSFGRYTAESVVTYGPTRLEARDQVVIWILPWYLDLAAGLLVAVIIWIIFHGRHIHKRRVIRKHLQTQK